MGDSAAAVELLQLQVQQLLIRVDILERKVSELEKGGNHGTLDGFEVVSSAAPRPSSPSRTSSSSSTYNSLALGIPELPSEALRACATLRGGKLSFKQRAERAWTAGHWARFTLEGRISKPRPTSPCDLANTTYVVVKAEGISEPVRVEKASDYRALLGDFTGSTSISHGFASKAEAKVYCVALNIPYPEKLFQWS